jgi:hypothetical protein
VTCSFKGVVSGIEARSVGQIWLYVQFGTLENFRVEDVLFDVVNLEIPFVANPVSRVVSGQSDHVTESLADHSAQQDFNRPRWSCWENLWGSKPG